MIFGAYTIATPKGLAVTDRDVGSTHVHLLPRGPDTTMIVAALMLVASVICVVLYVRRLFTWDDPRVARADTRPAPWFQLASYAGGRITHLTPMRDGVHVEDEDGACACNPSSGPYRTVDDRSGVLYVHHILDGGLERSAR